MWTRRCTRPVRVRVPTEAAFHQTYRYLWGNRPDLLPVAERLRAWDARVQWLLSSITVLDRADRRYLRRA